LLGQANKEGKQMKGYKAFNKDMTCRGFQYEEGKIYEESKAECCESGFHFCENPLDVLNYYNLCESEFAEVEALGEIHRSINSNDTKAATTKIKIGAKIGLSGIIKASFEYLWEKCYANIGDKNIQAASGYNSQLATSGDGSKLAASGDGSQLAASGYGSKLAASGYNSKLATSGDGSKLAASGDGSQLAASGDGSKLAASGYNSKLAASGDGSQLAASGYNSKLAASGYGSKLAASGDNSQLAASGYGSKLAASGYNSQLVMEGENSVGAAIGINNIIKGKIGCWITLAEYEPDGNGYKPICVKSAQIDGIELKPDTWYKLENGEFVEVGNE
jgi:hypothetical protein